MKKTIAIIVLLFIALFIYHHPIDASQHDFSITTSDANTGVTMRAAINAALQALASNNSGATEPTTTYAYMWWVDTTTGILKQRNAANDGWIEKISLTGTPVERTTTVGTSRTVEKDDELIICTGACAITPKTPAIGRSICARNAPGVTSAITLINLTGVYYEKTDHSGWQANANYKLVSGGAATDQICVTGYDSTHYAITSSTGTWTHTAP